MIIVLKYLFILITAGFAIDGIYKDNYNKEQKLLRYKGKVLLGLVIISLFCSLIFQYNDEKEFSINQEIYEQNRDSLDKKIVGLNHEISMLQLNHKHQLDSISGLKQDVRQSSATIQDKLSSGTISMLSGMKSSREEIIKETLGDGVLRVDLSLAPNGDVRFELVSESEYTNNDIEIIIMFPVNILEDCLLEPKENKIQISMACAITSSKFPNTIKRILPKEKVTFYDLQVDKGFIPMVLYIQTKKGIFVQRILTNVQDKRLLFDYQLYDFTNDKIIRKSRHNFGNHNVWNKYLSIDFDLVEDVDYKQNNQNN